MNECPGYNIDKNEEQVVKVFSNKYSFILKRKWFEYKANGFNPCYIRVVLGGEAP